MDNHFIKNIEIKNFKCFEDFKADGFGRVNLIGGKNNVGKTALLEALYINSNSKSRDTFISSIQEIYLRRHIFFKIDNTYSLYLSKFKNLIKLIKSFNKMDKPFIYLLEDKIKLDIKTNFNNCNLRIKGKEFISHIGNFQKPEQFKIKDNIEFIQSSHYIVYSNLYIKINLLKEFDRLDIFNKKINSFNKNFEKIEFKDKQVFIRLLDNKKLINLAEFGDGIKQYINILSTMLISTHGIIFIDEIEDGIHYLQFDQLWGIILTMAKEESIQIFATTHSKECIESFNRVQQKLEDKNTYYFELIKNIKTDKIFTRKLDTNQLKYELTHNGEFRG